MPGVPRIGFSFVDVRDVADLQIRAMTAPEAAGQRLIAVGEFAWMSEVAEILRDRLGDDAAKVPTRRVPNLLVRAMGVFDPGVRSIVGQLGRRSSYSSEKARTTPRLDDPAARGHRRRDRPQHARLTHLFLCILNHMVQYQSIDRTFSALGDPTPEGGSRAARPAARRPSPSWPRRPASR